ISRRDNIADPAKFQGPTAPRRCALPDVCPGGGRARYSGMIFSRVIIPLIDANFGTGTLAPVGGDLGNQLLEDGVAEGLVILRGDHEGAGAADDAVVVIAVEVGLEREDRQTVDPDAGGHCLVAGERDRPTAIVGAVAGDVDDPAAGAKRAAGKQRERVIDGPADRGAAAE